MTIAWYDPTNHHVSTDKHDPRFTPLGQLLPLGVPREWVGLTDEEQSFVYDKIHEPPRNKPFWVAFACAIESKLREKNT